MARHIFKMSRNGQTYFKNFEVNAANQLTGSCMREKLVVKGLINIFQLFFFSNVTLISGKVNELVP